MLDDLASTGHSRCCNDALCCAVLGSNLQRVIATMVASHRNLSCEIRDLEHGFISPDQRQ